MTDRAHRPDGSETERVHQAVAVAFPRQLARNSARELFVVLCGMALANDLFIYHVLNQLFSTSYVRLRWIWP